MRVGASSQIGSEIKYQLARHECPFSPRPPGKRSLSNSERRRLFVTSCPRPSRLLSAEPAGDAAFSLGSFSLDLVVELVHLLEGGSLGIPCVGLRLVRLGPGLCLELLDLGLRLCDLFASDEVNNLVPRVKRELHERQSWG